MQFNDIQRNEWVSAFGDNPRNIKKIVELLHIATTGAEPHEGAVTLVREFTNVPGRTSAIAETTTNNDNLLHLIIQCDATPLEKASAITFIRTHLNDHFSRLLNQKNNHALTPTTLAISLNTPDKISIDTTSSPIIDALNPALSVAGVALPRTAPATDGQVVTYVEKANLAELRQLITRYPHLTSTQHKTAAAVLNRCISKFPDAEKPQAESLINAFYIKAAALAKKTALTAPKVSLETANRVAIKARLLTAIISKPQNFEVVNALTTFYSVNALAPQIAADGTAEPTLLHLAYDACITSQTIEERRHAIKTLECLVKSHTHGGNAAPSEAAVHVLGKILKVLDESNATLVTTITPYLTLNHIDDVKTILDKAVAAMAGSKPALANALITIINAIPVESANIRKEAINAKNVHGNTLLHLAISHGDTNNYAYAHALLDIKDIDVEQKNREGDSALYLAVASLPDEATATAAGMMLVTLISKLQALETITPPSERNARQQSRINEYNALYAMTTRRPIAQVCKNVSANAITAIAKHLSIETADLAMLNQFIEEAYLLSTLGPEARTAGAAIYQEVIKNPNITGWINNTGLEHLDILLGPIPAEFGQGLLHQAAKAGRVDLVDAIIRESKIRHLKADGTADPVLDILRADVNGITALHLAAEAGNAGIIEKLLNESLVAKVDAPAYLAAHKDIKGRTLRDYAILGAAKRPWGSNPEAEQAEHVQLLNYLDTANVPTRINKENAREAFTHAFANNRYDIVEKLARQTHIDFSEVASKALNAAAKDPAKNENKIIMLLEPGFFTFAALEPATYNQLLQDPHLAKRLLARDDISLENADQTVLDALAKKNDPNITKRLKEHANAGSRVELALKKIFDEAIKDGNQEIVNNLLGSNDDATAELPGILKMALDNHQTDIAVDLINRPGLDVAKAQALIEAQIPQPDPSVPGEPDSAVLHRTIELFAALDKRDDLAVNVPNRRPLTPEESLNLAKARAIWDALLIEKTPADPTEAATHAAARNCLAKRYPALTAPTVAAATPASATTPPAAEPVGYLQQTTQADMPIMAAAGATATQIQKEAATVAERKATNLTHALLERRKALLASIPPASTREQVKINTEIEAIERDVLNTAELLLKSNQADRAKALYREAVKHKFTTIITTPQQANVPGASNTATSQQGGIPPEINTLWLDTLEALGKASDASTVEKAEQVLRGLIRAYGNDLVRRLPNNVNAYITPSAQQNIDRAQVSLCPEAVKRANDKPYILDILVKAFFSPKTDSLSKLLNDASLAFRLALRESNPKLKEAYKNFAEDAYQKAYDSIARSTTPPRLVIKDSTAELPRHLKTRYRDAIKENKVAQVQLLTYLYPKLYDELITSDDDRVSPLQWACKQKSLECIIFLAQSPGLKSSDNSKNKVLTTALKGLVDASPNDPQATHALDQLLRSAATMNDTLRNEILAYAKTKNAVNAVAAIKVLEDTDLVALIGRRTTSNGSLASNASLSDEDRLKAISTHALSIIRQTPTSVVAQSTIKTEQALRKAANAVTYDVPDYDITIKSTSSSTENRAAVGSGATSTPATNILTCTQVLSCTPTATTAATTASSTAKELKLTTVIDTNTGNSVTNVTGIADIKLKATIIAQHMRSQAITALQGKKFYSNGDEIPNSTMTKAQAESLLFCQVADKLIYNNGDANQLATLVEALVEHKIFPVLKEAELTQIAAVMLPARLKTFKDAYKKMEDVYIAQVTGAPLPTDAKAHGHDGAQGLFAQIQAGRNRPDYKLTDATKPTADLLVQAVKPTPVPAPVPGGSGHLPSGPLPGNSNP